LQYIIDNFKIILLFCGNIGANQGKADPLPGDKSMLYINSFAVIILRAIY
jgi:hypothetical protein